MKLKTLLVLVLVLATPSFAIPRATGAVKAAAPAPKVDHDLQVLIDSAGPDTNIAGFVTFQPAVQHSAALATIQTLGLQVGVDLPDADSVYAWGPAKGFATLSTSNDVQRLQIDKKLPFLRSTGTWATRAREVYTPTGGLDMRVKDANGRYIDGTGVGIAIVDSGIDALHPDLKYCHLGSQIPGTCKTAINYKVRCSTSFVAVGFRNVDTGECLGPVVMRDVADSDSSSGHGTHVAGIAAGSGFASTGTVKSHPPMFQGVAPGATLYGFGSGETEFIDTFAAAASFERIIHDGTSWNPPVRVINNSYGAPGNDDQSDVLTKLSNAAIAKGITVVWAAGNSGATSTGSCNDSLDPTTPCTSINANNRTPGNLSIANYDDNGTGSRNNTLESDSSQGLPGRPETYPTVAAPGSSISSTCLPYIPDCSAYGSFALPEPGYQPYYTILSGTSMASPHAVGVVALLYQADPTITPARVQAILEDTAHKFGTGYDANGTSVDKGHGLIDAHAAVLEAMNLPADTGLNQASSGETVVADGDGGDQTANRSLDLVRVAVDDDAANNRVNVSWTVLNTDSKPKNARFRYELDASVDGTARKLSVDWDGTNVSCSQDLSNDCVASLSGTTFTASYDAVALGAVAGSPMFDMWASTYGGPTNNVGLPCYGGSVIGLLELPAPCVQDRAPGLDGKKPAGAAAYLAPERGPSHIFTFTGTAATAPNPCVAPGLPILSDPAGDSLDGQSGHDVLGLSISEVGSSKVMFTLRTASLASLPKSTTWPLQFVGANGASHEADMTTDVTGAVSFTIDGAAADPSSTYFPDGRIEIVASRSAVGAPNAGDTIHAFLTRVTIDPVGITPDNMPNSLTPSGSYSVAGNC